MISLLKSLYRKLLSKRGANFQSSESRAVSMNELKQAGVVVAFDQFESGHTLSTSSCVLGAEDPKPFTMTKTIFTTSAFKDGSMQKYIESESLEEAKSNHLKVKKYLMETASLPNWMKDSPFKK